jgi:hypothetical protein
MISEDSHVSTAPCWHVGAIGHTQRCVPIGWLLQSALRNAEPAISENETEQKNHPR